LALGKTIAELEEGMTSAEFSEWLAYDRVGGVADLNLAQAHISQTVEASMGGDPRKLLDCRVLAHVVERQELSPEQTAGVLGRMAAERAQQTRGGKTL